MKFLIFGKEGMLGHDLIKEFEGDDLVSYNKEEVDITNQKIVKTIIKEIKPEVVINAAAYTDVDGCEINKELAFAVNGKAVSFIAKACKESNAEFLHISTDYVFDGQQKKGYKEEDKKSPINIYGQSKSFGEDMIKKNMENYYIIRTSSLYGKNGKNFVNTMLKLSTEKEQLTVVNDQVSCPTYTKDLAKVIKELLKNRKYGIFHVTNSSSCTWYEFTKKIFELIKRDIKIIPLTSQELGRLAKRPAHSILINTKLKPLRPWQHALEEYLRENDLL